MRGLVARQALGLVVGIFGAALFAVAISAIGEPRPANLPAYLMAFADRLRHLAQFDLGRSAASGTPVLQELARHLPPTLQLLTLGAGVALIVGLPLGVAFALGPGRKVAAPILQIVTATPVFCAGLALAFGAVHLLHWPVSINSRTGTVFPPDQVWQIALLPVLTVGLAGAAAVQLALRRAAATACTIPFRQGLRRLGLTGTEIETRFVLPYALAGLFAASGRIMLSLVSAAVVAEWVFHRQGAADLFVKSVALADWNMAALILFVFGLLTAVADFLGRLTAFALAAEDPS